MEYRVELEVATRDGAMVIPVYVEADTPEEAIKLVEAELDQHVNMPFLEFDADIATHVAPGEVEYVKCIGIKEKDEQYENTDRHGS